MSRKAGKKAKNKTVTPGEDLTVGRVSEIRDLLSHELEQSGNLTVDATGAAEVDITFLQLMCSLHRTALSLGKEVTLEWKQNQAMRQAVDDNGYSRSRGCVADITNSCLWMERTDE